MRRILRARLLASVLAVGIVPMVAAAVPAHAQVQWNVGFDSFHDQLAQYGDWVYSDRWGLVWQPADVPNDFRPYYSGGRWAYTGTYGWTWASDYEWGDIAFHYGRWIDDPYDGWMWIPGYSWSPGWVVWRSNQRSVGWMAMPPDSDFLSGREGVSIGIAFGGVSVNWNDTSGDYGYSRWYGRDYDQRRFAASWTFVDTGHMADRDYRRVAYAPDRASISIRQTTNITNYTVVNNYMVNRSVDVRAVERASGHPVAPVAAAMVFKHPGTVVTVDASQKIHAREFDRAPHGTGIANSAPPPPPAVINKLSDHVAAHHAGGTAGLAGKTGGSDKSVGAPLHLFTKTTITAPAATTQFHGKLPAGPVPAGAPVPPPAPPGLQTGPAGAAPVTTKTVPGTVAGPSNGASTSVPDTKMHEKRNGGPSTATGPTGAPANKPEKVFPSEQKGVQPPAGPVVKPVTEPAVKPLEHKFEQPVTRPVVKPVTEPTVKPLDHKIVQPETQPVVKPVSEPAMKPLEHKVVQPETQPVVKPVTEPAVKPLDHKVEQPVVQPVPVVHNPPPVDEGRKPSTKTPDEPKKDDPKKDEHKNKGEQTPPN